MIRVRKIFMSSMLALAVTTAGCGGVIKTEADYKSAAKVRPLEVPPDLLSPSRDDRFSVSASGSASRSEFDRSRTDPRRVDQVVLPVQDGMRIERHGDQRTLVVDQPAEKLWPVVRQFWLDNGFALAAEKPEIGFIETEWAENRSKIPEDLLRRTLGKVLDRLYDTGERDKFRTRLDRVSDSRTEIVISHRGVMEVVTSATLNIQSTWTNRPVDRELEAEFMRRLMLRLGADQARAQTLLVQSATVASTSQMVKAGEAAVIDIAEPFDRAWRRVGVAIDRLGFTVEDRDRNKGLFFVRYRDPTVDLQKEKPGFFARIFSSGMSSESAEQYRLSVTADGQDRARVSVQDKNGKPVSDAIARRMLGLLFDQLK